MCHHNYPHRATLKEEIARELLEGTDEVDEHEEPSAREADPSFLNETRETDVELLTDGGDSA